MSTLVQLLDLSRDAGNTWTGPGYGPAGKRAFGGQFLAQSMAAAARTVDEHKLPVSLHLQFLRAGTGGATADYEVDLLYDGRTASARRVLARQDGRLITASTVAFAAPVPGPEHGNYGDLPDDPDLLAATGPAGPAPGLPLDEIDIRISDAGEGEGFVRRFWWRTKVSLPDDPVVHACVALFVTDVYMIDPALRVHGHSMSDRSHRSGTTDASAWFHRRIRADRWNLLESRSPAAARGRGLVTASLIGTDGLITATLAQEGLIAAR